MYEHDGCVDTPVFTVNRWTKCEEPWNESPLFLHPAPAAPQAEPSAALIRAYNSGYMQGHHDTVESCFTDIHQSDMDTYHADVVAELGLTAAPQAEPKREPLSDERIDEIGEPFGYFQYGDAQGDKRRAFARAVERAAYERAAQECEPHEDDDSIDRQTKRELAERILALGRRHD
jgi:hypothetical protein